MAVRINNKNAHHNWCLVNYIKLVTWSVSRVGGCGFKSWSDLHSVSKITANITLAVLNISVQMIVSLCGDVRLVSYTFSY